MLGVHRSGHALRPDREAEDRLHANQPGPLADTMHGPACLLCRSCSGTDGCPQMFRNTQRALSRPRSLRTMCCAARARRGARRAQNPAMPYASSSPSACFLVLKTGYVPLFQPGIATWHKRSPHRASRRPPRSTDGPRACCGRPGLGLSTDAWLGELDSSAGAASYEMG